MIHVIVDDEKFNKGVEAVKELIRATRAGSVIDEGDLTAKGFLMTLLVLDLGGGVDKLR